MTPALAPMGWTIFSQTRPLSKEQWLPFVNRAVNEAIDFDQRLPSTTDAWMVAPTHGVCHDYALTKRELLLHLGYHAGELLLCECELADGQHHMVLLVNGQVLDSINPVIVPVEKMRYSVVRQQSSADPNHWENP